MLAVLAGRDERDKRDEGGTPVGAKSPGGKVVGGGSRQRL